MVNLKNCLTAGVMLFGAVFALYGNKVVVGTKRSERKVPASGSYSVAHRGSSVFTEKTGSQFGQTASYSSPSILAPGLRGTALEGGDERNYI